MSNQKNDQKKPAPSGCNSCGDHRTMLSEEKYSPARCAGCGKAIAPVKSN